MVSDAANDRFVFVVLRVERIDHLQTDRCKHDNYTVGPPGCRNQSKCVYICTVGSVETSNFFFYLSKSKSNCSQNYLSKSKSILSKKSLFFSKKSNKSDFFD